MASLSIIDYVVLTVVLVFCGLMLVSKSLVKVFSAFLGVLVTIALVFLMANSGFLFVTQLLLYVGSVSILFVFSIMLTKRLTLDKSLESENHNWLAGFSLLGILSGVFLLVLNKKFGVIEVRTSDDVKALGTEIVSNYLICFELLGVFLLIALILAASIAGKKQKA